MHVIGDARAGSSELRHDGMDAARIVAHHTAQSTMIVRGRIGAECQTVFLRGAPEIVQHDAGLHARQFCFGIDVENAIVIFRHIHHDRDVATLTGQRSTATARENWRAMLTADGDDFNDVVFALRQNHANRRLAIIGRVRGVQSARAVIEAHFAFDGIAEVGIKCFARFFGGFRRGVFDVKRNDIRHETSLN